MPSSPDGDPLTTSSLSSTITPGPGCQGRRFATNRSPSPPPSADSGLWQRSPAQPQDGCLSRSCEPAPLRPSPGLGPPYLHDKARSLLYVCAEPRQSGQRMPVLDHLAGALQSIPQPPLGRAAPRLVRLHNLKGMLQQLVRLPLVAKARSRKVEYPKLGLLGERAGDTTAVHSEQDDSSIAVQVVAVIISGSAARADPSRGAAVPSAVTGPDDTASSLDSIRGLSEDQVCGTTDTLGRCA